MQFQVTKDFSSGQTTIQLVSLITTLQQNKITLDNHYNFISEVKPYSVHDDQEIQPISLQQASEIRQLHLKEDTNANTNLLLVSKDGTISVFNQVSQKVISSIEVISNNQKPETKNQKHKKNPHFMIQMNNNIVIVVKAPQTTIRECVEGSIVNMQDYQQGNCSSSKLSNPDLNEEKQNEVVDNQGQDEISGVEAILFQIFKDGRFYVLHRVELESMPTHVQVNQRMLALYMKYKRDRGFKKFFKLYVYDLWEHNVLNLKRIPADQNIEYIIPPNQIPQAFSSSKRCKSLEFDDKDIILITKTGNDKYFLTRYAPAINRIYDLDNPDAREMQDQLEKSKYTVAQSVEISSAQVSAGEKKCVENNESEPEDDVNNDDSSENNDDSDEEEEIQHQNYPQTVINSLVSAENHAEEQKARDGQHGYFKEAMQALAQERDDEKLKSLEHLTGVSESQKANHTSMAKENEGPKLVASADEVEYQFRTCRLFASAVVAGRFDTYLLVQKRRRPLRCVLHSFFQQKQCLERLAVSSSTGGFIVAAIAPSRASINIYKNFQFDRQIRLQVGRKTIGHLKDVSIDKNGQLWTLGAHGALYQLGTVTRVHAAVKVPPLTNFCINRAGTAVIAEDPAGNVFLLEITEDSEAIVSKLVYLESSTAKQSTRIVQNESTNTTAQKEHSAATNSDSIGVLTHISTSDAKQNQDTLTDGVQQSMNLISVEKSTEKTSTREQSVIQTSSIQKPTFCSSSIKIKPQGATITRFCIQHNGIIDIFWRDDDGLVNTVMMQSECTTKEFSQDIRICDQKIKRQWQPKKISKFGNQCKMNNTQGQKPITKIWLNNKNLSIMSSYSYQFDDKNKQRQVFINPADKQSYDAIEYLRFIVQQARNVDTRVSKTALNTLNSLIRSLLYGKDIRGFVPGLNINLVTNDPESFQTLIRVVQFLFTLPNVTLYGRDLLKEEDAGLEMPSSDVVLEIVYLHIVKGTSLVPEALELLASFILQDEGYLAEILGIFKKDMLEKQFPASPFLKSLIQLGLISVVLKALSWCEQQAIPSQFERIRLTAFLILERIILSFGSDNAHEDLQVYGVPYKQMRQELINILTNELLFQLKDMENGHFLTTGRISLRVLRFLEINFDQLAGLNALKQLLSQDNHPQLRDILSAGFWISIVSNTFQVFMDHFTTYFSQYKNDQRLVNIISEIIFYMKLYNYKQTEDMDAYIKQDNISLFGRLYNIQDSACFDELQKENQQLLTKYVILCTCNADLTVISDLHILQILYSIYKGINYQQGVENMVKQSLMQQKLNIGHNFPIFAIQLALLSGKYQKTKIIQWLQNENIKIKENIFHSDLLFYSEQYVYTVMMINNKYVSVGQENQLMNKFDFKRDQQSLQFEQRLATLLVLVQKDIVYLSKKDDLQNRLAPASSFNLKCYVVNENQALITFAECLSYFVKSIQVQDVYLPPWFLEWIITFYQENTAEKQYLRQKIK